MPALMESVIHTHNSMNEMTWERVVAWERLHPESRDSVKLNRFLGRPHDLSPLARLRTLFGYPAPFDRHEWFLLRGDQEVRYVVDFYFDDAYAGRPEVRPCPILGGPCANRCAPAQCIACWGRA
jgi:cytochrome c heme-lyase